MPRREIRTLREVVNPSNGRVVRSLRESAAEANVDRILDDFDVPLRRGDRHLIGRFERRAEAGNAVDDLLLDAGVPLTRRLREQAQPYADWSPPSSGLPDDHTGDEDDLDDSEAAVLDLLEAAHVALGSLLGALRARRWEPSDRARGGRGDPSAVEAGRRSSRRLGGFAADSGPPTVRSPSSALRLA